MIEKIVVLKDNLGYENRKLAVFKAGMEIRLENCGINLLVGDNGIGKSTLLNIIKNDGLQHYMGEKVLDIVGDRTSFCFYDTEKMNPRIKDMGKGNSKQFKIGLASMFMSHGQASQLVVSNMKHVNNGDFVIIDEPEAAISLMNQMKVIKEWEKVCVEKKATFLVATHSPVLMLMKPDKVKVNIIELDDTYKNVVEWVRNGI